MLTRDSTTTLLLLPGWQWRSHVTRSILLGRRLHACRFRGLSDEILISRKEFHEHGVAVRLVELTTRESSRHGRKGSYGVTGMHRERGRRRIRVSRGQIVLLDRLGLIGCRRMLNGRLLPIDLIAIGIQLQK